jgi:hypothetical protein
VQPGTAEHEVELYCALHVRLVPEQGPSDQVQPGCAEHVLVL